VQQLSRVNALSVKLTAEQHLDTQLDTVLADIASIFEAPRAALVLFDQEQQIASLVATVPAALQQPAALPAVAELLAPLVSQRPQLIIPSADSADPLSQLVLACDMQLGVLAPLPASAAIAGLLLLEPPRQAKDWQASDRNLVQTVANLLAQAIENNQLQQQRMQRLRADMSRYMAPELVEQLLTEGRFEPTERDVVVVFADLRGFTALSEGLAPRIVVEQVLNRFFALMTDVLYAHEATIDKFLGDGLMAVFGSIIDRPDDISRAVQAAVAMQRAFTELQASWNRELGRDIGLGIGISWGRAVVGNLGSPQRLDYTLIGDVVNTASRLVDLAESGQIIVSQHVVDQLPPQEHGCLAALPAVMLKGKGEKLAIYSVEYQQMIETGS